MVWKFKLDWPSIFSQVDVLSRVHHKNLVALVGYCQSEHDSILIYEYVQNGSLFNHLHGEFHSSDLGSWAGNLSFDAVVLLAEGFEVLEGVGLQLAF